MRACGFSVALARLISHALQERWKAEHPAEWVALQAKWQGTSKQLLLIFDQRVRRGAGDVVEVASPGVLPVRDEQLLGVGHAPIEPSAAEFQLHEISPLLRLGSPGEFSVDHADAQFALSLTRLLVAQTSRLLNAGMA